jgi:hypothetical protein
MAFIRINYNDGNQENLGYESVELHYGKDLVKCFSSKNFIKDWWDIHKFMILELSDKLYFTKSSSVDHFIMDGAPYDSAFLHVIDGKSVLKYIDYRDEDYLYSQQDIYEGIEFFVPQGTKPTWEELEEICK